MVFNQELGTETTNERDAKAAGSFGVDVEEMVDEGIVRGSVKVAEFGVGRGEVGAGDVAMDEAMLERLGKVDMHIGSEDFLRGLVTGSAREGIDNTNGLIGSMADGEGKLGEKVQLAGLTRGDILFGEDIGDDGVVSENCEVLAIEVRAQDFKGIDDGEEFLLIGGMVHLSNDELLTHECNRYSLGASVEVMQATFGLGWVPLVIAEDRSALRASIFVRMIRDAVLKSLSDVSCLCNLRQRVLQSWTRVECERHVRCGGESLELGNPVLTEKRVLMEFVELVDRLQVGRLHLESLVPGNSCQVSLVCSSDTATPWLVKMLSSHA
ncbi:hypothetical protein CBR_g81563 [Chara braunii]|uniref:Uncharacterized protein n=1 Tax=Chara braunii TaxID=69332 RepID=A0A388KAP9_CHABU|nr:hypothetical protein CBR_g81563 [Chara braunii]|eukprot:GBG67138.1 hypothetical protein CBR_g81563 [Chara braunii]